MTHARISIIETTDLHMHLMGFDYTNQKPSRAIGLTNLCPMIAQVRQNADLTLLFDNGDFLQGNPLAENLAAQADPAQPHPVVNAMTALEYDAITLGNHEFDYGLDYLQDVLADAPFPIVCANLRTSPQETLYPPWTVLTRQVTCDDGETREIRIGVIGFVTPQIVDWDAHLLRDRVQTDDIIAAARTYLPQLRREGVDLTVALCHSGISTRPYHDRMENAALHLAALPGIDVVLSGHTHDLFPDPQFDGIAGIDTASGTLHGKPAVMAGAYGVALGVIDLHLSHTPDGWHLLDHKVNLMMTADQPAPATENDAVRSITDSLAAAQLATLEHLQEIVTRTPRRLTTYLSAVGLDQTAPLMAEAQRAYIQRALQGTPYASLPLLSATASFRAGGQGGAGNFSDIAPGPLTQADVSAIAPFNNPLCAVLVRGWQIRQWLNVTSGYFNTFFTPGTPVPLLNPHIPHYHFDTLHGLRYRIDLRVPSGIGNEGHFGNYRVRDVTYEGILIEDDAVFVVAASSYRVFGGGGQITVKSDDVIYTSREGLTTILCDQLREHGVGDDFPQNPWSFVPFTGGQFTFVTSPNAMPQIVDLGLAQKFHAGRLLDNGFQEFTLHL